MMAVSACICGVESIGADWILFFDKSIELFMSADLFSNPEKCKAFDALFVGKKQDKEKLLRQINEDSRTIFQYLKENYNDKVIVVPGGKKADWFIVSLANETNGYIVSNDTFTRGSDALLSDKYPFVKDPNRVCQFCKVQGDFFVEGTGIKYPIPTSYTEAVNLLKQSADKRVAQSSISLSEEQLEIIEIMRKVVEGAQERDKIRKEKIRSSDSLYKDYPGSGISLKDIFKALF